MSRLRLRYLLVSWLSLGWVRGIIQANCSANSHGVVRCPRTNECLFVSCPDYAGALTFD